jgi:hypothetical protein
MIKNKSNSNVHIIVRLTKKIRNHICLCYGLTIVKKKMLWLDKLNLKFVTNNGEIDPSD